MNDVYLSLADGFDKLAAGYRELAKKGADDKAAPAVKPAEHKYTRTEVRELLSKKSGDGKTPQVKALLLKYDAGNLSGVKPEDYAALYAEAEVL